MLGHFGAGAGAPQAGLAGNGRHRRRRRPRRRRERGHPRHPHQVPRQLEPAQRRPRDHRGAQVAAEPRAGREQARQAVGGPRRRKSTANLQSCHGDKLKVTRSERHRSRSFASTQTKSTIGGSIGLARDDARASGCPRPGHARVVVSNTPSFRGAIKKVASPAARRRRTDDHGDTLSKLAKPAGATKPKKRLGRGVGSGLGKTAGRAQGPEGPHRSPRRAASASKAARRRSAPPPQARLQEPVPQGGVRGQRRRPRERFAAGAVVDEALRRDGPRRKLADRIKILGDGELTKRSPSRRTRSRRPRRRRSRRRAARSSSIGSAQALQPSRHEFSPRPRFANIGKVPELRRRILFTLALLAVYRIGVFVTIPGRRPHVMNAVVTTGRPARSSASSTCSAAARCEHLSIFALGIMPYVSARIILQLLTMVFKPLDELARKASRASARSTSTRATAPSCCRSSRRFGHRDASLEALNNGDLATRRSRRRRHPRGLGLPPA